ncbi:hypothetical protein [Massilia psychrophila]|nr:hypothetical protein [Massilia psychrophila]
MNLSFDEPSHLIGRTPNSHSCMRRQSSIEAPPAGPSGRRHNVVRVRAVIAAELDESLQQLLRRVKPLLGGISEQITDIIAIVAQQLALPFGDVPMLYPRTMTRALTHVLGFPNFRTSPIAHVFRKAGFAIPTQSKAEHAFMLDRLICAALAHGEGWAEVFSTDVRTQLDIVEVKNPAAQAVP